MPPVLRRLRELRPPRARHRPRGPARLSGDLEVPRPAVRAGARARGARHPYRLHRVARAGARPDPVRRGGLRRPGADPRCPDCGLRTRSWDVAYEKLVAMVEGARLAEEASRRTALRPQSLRDVGYPESRRTRLTGAFAFSMRTTLKRGIGRGAEVNGNGHGDPAARRASPVTLYRQAPPPSPGLKLVGKFFFWLVTLAWCSSSGLVGGFYLWAHESAAALHGRPTGQAHAAAPRLDQRRAPCRGRPRDRLRPSSGRRGRSLALRHDDADARGPVTKMISLLSLPRDLAVPIWCPSRTASGADEPAELVDHGRINSAYATAAPKARSRRCGT